MSLYNQINAIESSLKDLRELDDQKIIRQKVEDVVFDLRRVYLEYRRTKKSIDWLEIEQIARLSSEMVSSRKKVKREKVEEFSIQVLKLINEAKKEILPKRKRYAHFAGSVAFIFIIPIVKFFLSYSNKKSEAIELGKDFAISYFDITLPLIIYCWIACYTTMPGIRRTWILTFTLISTSLLLKSSNEVYFFYTILTLSSLTLVIHTRDSWSKYVEGYEYFSYYKS